MHHSRRRTSTGKAKRPARRDKPEPIVFDPDGDLMLNLYGSASQAVGASGSEITRPEKVTMKVSSKLLIQKCPIFKRWLPASIEKGMELERPADGVDSMVLLLNIIHDRDRALHHAPTFTFEGLMRIAVLLHKYKHAKSIGPYKNRWIEDIKEELPKECTSATMPFVHGWLAIAWVFKHVEIYDEMRGFIAQHHFNLMSSGMGPAGAGTQRDLDSLHNVLAELGLKDIEQRRKDCKCLLLQPASTRPTLSRSRSSQDSTLG